MPDVELFHQGVATDASCIVTVEKHEGPDFLPEEQSIGLRSCGDCLAWTVDSQSPRKWRAGRLCADLRLI